MIGPIVGAISLLEQNPGRLNSHKRIRFKKKRDAFSAGGNAGVFIILSIIYGTDSASGR